MNDKPNSQVILGDTSKSIITVTADSKMSADQLPIVIEFPATIKQTISIDQIRVLIQAAQRNVTRAQEKVDEYTALLANVQSEVAKVQP